MTLSAVQLLHAHGAYLYVDPSSLRLRYRSPPGSLTPELRGLIAEAAMEYEERCAIREYSGCMDRIQAERLTASEFGAR